MFFTNARQEAYQIEKEQAKQSTITAALVHVFFKHVVVPLLKLAITYFLSILWVALLLFMAGKSMWLGLLAAAVLGAAVYYPQTRRFSIVGPYLKQRALKEAEARIAEGNAMLKMTGIVSINDETVYKCEAYRDDKNNIVLRIIEELPGITSEEVMNRLEKNRDKYRAHRMVRAEYDGAWLKVIFFTTDPLEEDQVISEPMPLDEDSMKVACAVDSVGKTQSLSFKQVSGMTVSGVPGSGKTAGLTSFLLPVALSENVELNIIDGKGGHDWAAYKPICAYYSNDDEDLQALRDYLQSAVDEVRERVQKMPEKLGVADFWHASAERRRAAGLKHKIIVIDECQTFFEKRTNKEENALIQDIVRLATSLVKKGRSAGITLIATTQKPTSESLPTGLRDNCPLRVCFRVTTKEAQKAALGDSSAGDDRIDALSIRNAGGAVILSEKGDVSRVRFYYMSPSDQERLIGEEVAKRKNP